MLALLLLAFGATVAAAPAVPVKVAPVAAGGSCVTKLVDLHKGSGDKLFTSRYSFDGAWALGTWSAGSVKGQSLWQRRGEAWCKVVGGSALDATDIQGYGVPSGVAHHLSTLQPPTRIRGH
ncbi:MAG: hypothetical protein ACLPYS_18235 [Vulcanimicrobiaceae bacterium]